MEALLLLAALPLDGVAEHFEHFLVAEVGGAIIGGAIAKRFAREGLVACVTRRSADKLAPLVDEIRAAAMARIPAGRYGTVDEFAAAAVFLASDQASFMTGSIVRVDGGQIASTM
mgnify:CR=1 FL=1